VAQQTVDIHLQNTINIKRKSCRNAVDCYNIGFIQVKYRNIGFRILVH